MADGVTFVLRDGGPCSCVDEDAISSLWKGPRFPIDQCISGWAMLHAEPAIVPDIYDERIPLEAHRPTFVKSLVMVPFGTIRPAGAIGAYRGRPHTATDDELAVVLRLAAATAAPIGRVGLDDAPFMPAGVRSGHRHTAPLTN